MPTPETQPESVERPYHIQAINDTLLPMNGWAGVIVVVLALSGCSQPQPETEQEQLPKVREMAEAGNAEAQYRMGLFALIGKVVPQSTNEAVRWWRKAADQNNLAAEHELGVIYFDGKIVPQDEAGGLRWLRKVAEQGENASGDFLVLSALEDARFRLGMAYWYGSGVKTNSAEAVKWFRKAAEQGEGTAQKLLGEAYAQGKGVRRDYVMRTCGRIWPWFQAHIMRKKTKIFTLLI